MLNHQKNILPTVLRPRLMRSIRPSLPAICAALLVSYIACSSDDDDPKPDVSYVDTSSGDVEELSPEDVDEPDSGSGEELIDPELGDEAGELVVIDGIPHREGGAAAILTQTQFGDEFEATLSFDATQPAERQVPDGIGSINLEVQFNAFNLVDAQAQLQQPVVERLEQLHLQGKTLRWPGGGYDRLDYQGCMGEVSERPEQVFFEGDPERCFFGPKEASELAQQLSAQLWMQVQPMLVPEPPEGDEHIAHGGYPVHQHNSGASETIDEYVANWQIGNEQYHYPAAEYSAQDFVAAAGHLIDAMRAEDEDIRLWAPVQENYSNNHFSAQPDWTPTILEELASDLHGLTIHNGYAPVQPQANSPEEVSQAYRAMFSNTLWAAENLADVEALIQDLAPNEYDRLRFAITEANAAFGILPFEHNLMNHTQTLASAAYMASMLATYARHPRVDYVHLFTGVQFTTQGLIGVTDDSFTALPDTYSATGLMLHLWNQWATDELLGDVAVDSPTFSSPDRGWMSGRDDIANLDALVRRSDDELGILLVNRSLEESARVELDIADLTATTMEANAVLGRAPDSNPGLTIPDVVDPVEPAVLERFSEGGVGEVWIRSEEAELEEADLMDGLPTIRVPRSSIVFLSLF